MLLLHRKIFKKCFFPRLEAFIILLIVISSSIQLPLDIYVYIHFFFFLSFLLWLFRVESWVACSKIKITYVQVSILSPLLMKTIISISSDFQNAIRKRYEKPHNDERCHVICLSSDLTLYSAKVGICMYIRSVFLIKCSIFIHNKCVNYLTAFQNHLRIKTWLVQRSFSKLCCTLKGIL